MTTLLYLLQKEFLLIFRDRTILRLMFAMPIMQLLLIPMAADYEVRNISLAVIDHDHSSQSERLVGKLDASTYFHVVARPEDYRDATELVARGRVDVVLTIPAGFDHDLVTTGRSSVQLAADAVNGVRAGLGTSYAIAMVRQFQLELAARQSESTPPAIEVTSANWYNPNVNYPLFMVPGILAILVTMVGGLLSALNIVKEKEDGTIEQINVSPVKKWQFILGKLIPFWLIGMITIGIGMVVALVVYRLVPVGSILTILAFAAVYLIGVLGIGLFLATISEHQQQATLFSFFVMMVFVLLGGLYTPIDSMPGWAQNIAAFNPPAYFVAVIRAVYIKGSTIGDMLPALARLAGFAIVFNLLAVWNYRKRTT